MRGNKLIAIGHRYSALVNFPEKETAPPWVVPVSVRRVPSEMTTTLVEGEQTTALMKDETLPFHDHLCVQISDSAYSVAPFLGWVAEQPVP